MTEPLYRGEAILLNWNDNKSGRKIVLQIEKDGPGPHPFDGMDGERFAVVIVGPIGNDEKPMKKLMGAVDGGPRSDRSSSRVETMTSSADVPAAPAKPKKRWHEMPPSQRAALLTRDPEFWEYLETCEVSRSTTEMAADASLKHLCNVDSKSSILPGTTAHARFVDLEGDFMAWRQARQHGAA